MSKAIHAMCQSFVEAKCTVRMHDAIVTGRQASDYQRGQLGYVRAFQVLEKGEVIAFVCDNGTVYMGIHPKHGVDALKALSVLDCNLGEKALEMDMRSAAEDHQDTILKKAGARLAKGFRVKS